MAVASLYYHCSSLIGADGLQAGALFAVPVIGAVLWGAERRRRARAARD